MYLNMVVSLVEDALRLVKTDMACLGEEVHLGVAAKVGLMDTVDFGHIFQKSR